MVSISMVSISFIIIVSVASIIVVICIVGIVYDCARVYQCHCSIVCKFGLLPTH